MNTCKHVQKAVESVVYQEEVVEIILVEDNSPDTTIGINQLSEKKYKKINPLKHPNGENRASASLNLGVLG